MPWCPNCKAEYQEGITVCSDCKIELVEDLKEAQVLIPMFQIGDKKVADKLVKFFNYSDLFSTYEFDDENEYFIVSVPPKQQMQARKLYQAFYMVERERAINGDSDLLPEEEEVTPDIDTANISDSPDADTYEASEINAQADDTLEEEEYEADTPSDEVTAFDDNEEDNTPANYVMKEDQYKDLTGTVWIFLIFGIVGLIIVILNVIGTLSFFNGWIPQTVMGGVFLVFIYIAITTNQKAKKIQTEIEAENKLTLQINEWLKANITDSFLASLNNENLSDEFNYIKKTDTIKEMLIKEFGPQNLAYLDRLIEEYYTENFDYVEN